MVVMLLLAFLGAAMSDNFADGDNQTLWAAGSALVGLLIGALVFWRGGAADSAETDTEPMDWGIVWILISGLLIVGIGLGAMLWVRAQGA